MRAARGTTATTTMAAAATWTPLPETISIHSPSMPCSITEQVDDVPRERRSASEEAMNRWARMVNEGLIDEPFRSGGRPA
jgi:hypothetical protein